MCWAQHLQSNNTDSNQSSNEHEESAKAIGTSLLELLKTLRQDENTKKKRKMTKINATPGKSVGVSNFTMSEDEDQIINTITVDLSLPSTSNQDVTRKLKKKSKWVDAISFSECSDHVSLKDSDEQLISSS